MWKAMCMHSHDALLVIIVADNGLSPVCSYAIALVKLHALGTKVSEIFN